MPRVKRGTTHVKRRRNILKATKGFMWGRKSKIKLAKVAALKAGKHAYIDRRRKKRTMKSLWLIKINAAARINGTKYSAMIDGLKKINSTLDRKVLAQIAEHYPEVFKQIAKHAK